MVKVEDMVSILDDGNVCDCQNRLYGPTLPVMLDVAMELHEHVDAKLWKKIVVFAT